MQLDSLAHADDPHAFLPQVGGVEALPVVLDHHCGSVAAADEQDAAPGGASVLDDVRQRFLDDAIERRLYFGGEPFLAELSLEIDADRRGFRERLREALNRGNQPEVIERLRPKLHCETSDVLERPYDEV